jgi:hypothetical protein
VTHKPEDDFGPVRSRHAKQVRFGLHWRSTLYIGAIQSAGRFEVTAPCTHPSVSCRRRPPRLDETHQPSRSA